MKKFTFFLTFILSIYGSSSMSMEAEKSDKISLPTTAILTGKLKDMNAIHVVLLGSSHSGKSRFISELFPKRMITIGADFDTLVLNDDVAFRIWDMAGREKFYATRDNYINNASVILIFDTTKEYIEQLKEKHGEHDYKIISLSYSNGECHLSSPKCLNCYDGSCSMEQYNEDTAHMLRESLFSKLAQEVRSYNSMVGSLSSTPCVEPEKEQSYSSMIGNLGSTLKTWVRF